MSFGYRKSESPWSALGDFGTQWRLHSFQDKQPPSWDSFWTDHRKYWRVDDPEGRKTRPWFWETFTEESFLTKARIEYEKLIDYYKHWNGLCKKGDVVSVIETSPTKIILSKNWKGSISDHSDLELSLYRTYTAFFVPDSFECSILSFGTITVQPGSIEAQMGERVGSDRICHDRASFTQSKDYRVEFDGVNGSMKIWDALFYVLNEKVA